MTEIHAKPIVDGKFWIVEEDGKKIATLHKKENNKFVLSSTNGEMMFNKKDDLTKQFGKGFFLSNPKVKVTDTEEVHEVTWQSKRNLPSRAPTILLLDISALS